MDKTTIKIFILYLPLLAAVATQLEKIRSEPSVILIGLSLLFGRYLTAHTAHLQGFES